MQRPIIDIFTEVLTTEARLGALGERLLAARAELLQRAIATKAADGVAPTWRAPGLGVVSMRDPKAKATVTDSDAFATWVAPRFPTEVTARLQLAVAADADRAVEILEAAGIPCTVGLTVREAFTKSFLLQCAAVDGDDPAVFAPTTGEQVDGVGLTTPQPGITVKLDNEARRRAQAELADPVAVGMLTAPLGELVPRETDRAPAEPVDDADAEPDYGAPIPDAPDPFDVPPWNPADAVPVPLDPVGAAIHASTVQGGFSTPAIEAYRILRDAVRTVRGRGVLDDRWRAGVRDTLTWIDANRTNEVVQQEHQFEAWLREMPDADSWMWLHGDADGTPPPWREILEDAAAEVDDMLKPRLVRNLARLGLDTKGTKDVLADRYRAVRAQRKDPAYAKPTVPAEVTP